MAQAPESPPASEPELDADEGREEDGSEDGSEDAPEAPAPEAPMPDAPTPDAPTPEAPSDELGDSGTGDEEELSDDELSDDDLSLDEEELSEDDLSLDEEELSEDDLSLDEEELSEDDLSLDEEELSDDELGEDGFEPSAVDDGGEAGEEVAEDDLTLRELSVAYTPEDIFRLGGSATVLDEAALDTFEYDDPHELLLQVPGVYVRGEDGFGLRPNIGLRGTNPNRSAKVTLLEDGVLFGPAPYSAPAAYFFPQMARMVGVEVFKGPAALLYGPQTIGGALNFLSREVPDGPEGEIDVALGRFLQRRIHGWWGTSNRLGGFVLEALDTGSEGFKDIDDSSRDTGFGRTELVGRGFLQTSPTGRIYNRFELKLSFARERSAETYLGLSDDDFAANAYRRYASSELDNMEWWRTGAELQWRLEVGDHVQVITTAYRHDFQRTWFRANRFRDGPSFHSVLTSPNGFNQDWYRILSGQDDSASDEEALLLVNNDRRFVSQGLQTRARIDAETGVVHHEVELGARVHHDQVRRDQVETAYAMSGGHLVALDEEESPISDNTGNALAVSGYAVYGLSFFDLTLTPGIHVEYIATSLEDRLAGETRSEEQTVVLPGIGLQYTFLERWGVLAGVHRGFSPVSPGNGDTAEPEFSVNYELGARFRDEERDLHVEAIGFLNDYSNLLVTCTSSSGCAAEDVDRQYNAGSAWVWGVEIAGDWRPELGSVAVPVKLSYTYTGTRFRDEFTSGSPGYEYVEEGDPLPYVPEHQAHLQLGIEHARVGGNVAFNVISPMRESTDDTLPETDLQVLMDAIVWGQLTERLRVYVRGQNLLDQRAISARRPFGARPVAPLSVMAGARVTL